MSSTDREPLLPYSPGYYDGIRAGSLVSARIVLPLVFELVRPRSVLDVGCGVGTWLSEAGELGAADTVGVDGDYMDRRHLSMAPDRFVAADLERPIDLGRRFDLGSVGGSVRR